MSTYQAKHQHNQECSTPLHWAHTRSPCPAVCSEGASDLVEFAVGLSVEVGPCRGTDVAHLELPSSVRAATATHTASLKWQTHAYIDNVSQHTLIRHSRSVTPWRSRFTDFTQPAGPTTFRNVKQPLLLLSLSDQQFQQAALVHMLRVPSHGSVRSHIWPSQHDHNPGLCLSPVTYLAHRVSHQHQCSHTTSCILSPATSSIHKCHPKLSTLTLYCADHPKPPSKLTVHGPFVYRDQILLLH